MGGLSFSQWLLESVTSDSLAFQKAISGGEFSACPIYADFLEENSIPVYPGTLEYLRSANSPTEVVTVHGAVWAGKKYSAKDVQDILSSSGHHFLSKDTMRVFNSRLSSTVFSGPNGIYFIVSNATPLTNNQREYLVVNLALTPQVHILTHDYFETLPQAKNFAKRLALGI